VIPYYSLFHFSPNTQFFLNTIALSYKRNIKTTFEVPLATKLELSFF
jgi:hypothetical protein